MKKNKIAKRLSLRAKFKSTDMIELVVMDNNNNVQIELIPITLKSVTEKLSDIESDEEVSDIESDGKDNE